VEPEVEHFHTSVFGVEAEDALPRGLVTLFGSMFQQQCSGHCWVIASTEDMCGPLMANSCEEKVLYSTKPLPFVPSFLTETTFHLQCIASGYLQDVTSSQELGRQTSARGTAVHHAVRHRCVTVSHGGTRVNERAGGTIEMRDRP
jgi:hypothetical protein